MTRREGNEPMSRHHVMLCYVMLCHVNISKELYCTALHSAMPTICNVSMLSVHHQCHGCVPCCCEAGSVCSTATACWLMPVR